MKFPPTPNISTPKASNKIRFLRPSLKRGLERLTRPLKKNQKTFQKTNQKNKSGLDQNETRDAVESAQTQAQKLTRQLFDLGLDPQRFLEELVAIDSMTVNPRGVNLVQKILADRLGRLGFKINWTKNPRGENFSGELLTATLPPEKINGPVQWINLVSHADTVLGHQTLGPFQVFEDGTKGRGAGVIDNKGGLVVALVGLEHYLNEQQKNGERKFGLRFVSSPNEEAGSPGFTELFRTYSQDALLVLGFEPALDDGSIIKSRRGNRWYHVKIKGIEAHAGRSKGEHLNAAHELAIKISRLHKLNSAKRGLAVNVGHFKGGHDKFNVVCGWAEAKIDTRFECFKTRDRLHVQIEKIFSEHSVFNIDQTASPEVSVEICDDCPPFASSRRSRALVREFCRQIEKVEGRAIEPQQSGGAGDVNYMSDPNIVVIDGLGPIGGRMHTAEEFISLPSLTTRAIALSRFLQHVEARF